VRAVEGDGKEPRAWGCNWATVTGGQIQGPGPPGCGLDARLTTLLCKKNIVTKPKEMKAGWNLAKSSKEGDGSKRAVLQIMMMMMNSDQMEQTMNFTFMSKNKCLLISLDLWDSQDL
jgi:hypothetical protein